VTDGLAKTFVETFYGELAEKTTVGEAVRRARAAANKAGDPTRLAYSVYAHPNAKWD
jgi:hypothetical protein